MHSITSELGAASSSSSLSSTQFCWELPKETPVFPLSDVRSLPIPRYRSCSLMPPTAPRTHTIPLEPPFWEQYEGIWTNGHRYMFSINLPNVQSLLHSARETYTLPEIDNRILYALCALATWNRITDPAHWMLWGDEKKISNSANAVKWACNHNPPFIRHTPGHGWSSFNVQTLRGLQTEKEALSDLPWYAALVPQSGRVLRKRNAATDTSEQSPPKRLKTNNHDSANRKSSHTKTSPSTPRPSRKRAAPLNATPPPPTRVSTRQQARSTAVVVDTPPPKNDSSPNVSSDLPPLTTSTPSSPQPIPHVRSSSEDTIVSVHIRRSLSASAESDATAVSPSGSEKIKGNRKEPDLIAAEVMVTRARSKAAKVAVVDNTTVDPPAKERPVVERRSTRRRR